MALKPSFDKIMEARKSGRIHPDLYRGFKAGFALDPSDLGGGSENLELPKLTAAYMAGERRAREWAINRWRGMIYGPLGLDGAECGGNYFSPHFASHMLIMEAAFHRGDRMVLDLAHDLLGARLAYHDVFKINHRGAEIRMAPGSRARQATVAEADIMAQMLRVQPLGWYGSNGEWRGNDDRLVGRLPGLIVLSDMMRGGVIGGVKPRFDKLRILNRAVALRYPSGEFSSCFEGEFRSYDNPRAICWSQRGQGWIKVARPFGVVDGNAQPEMQFWARGSQRVDLDIAGGSIVAGWTGRLHPDHPSKAERTETREYHLPLPSSSPTVTVVDIGGVHQGASLPQPQPPEPPVPPIPQPPPGPTGPPESRSLRQQLGRDMLTALATGRNNAQMVTWINLHFIQGYPPTGERHLLGRDALYMYERIPRDAFVRWVAEHFQLEGSL